MESCWIKSLTPHRKHSAVLIKHGSSQSVSLSLSLEHCSVSDAVTLTAKLDLVTALLMVERLCVCVCVRRL